MRSIPYPKTSFVAISRILASFAKKHGKALGQAGRYALKAAHIRMPQAVKIRLRRYGFVFYTGIRFIFPNHLGCLVCNCLILTTKHLDLGKLAPFQDEPFQFWHKSRMQG